MDNGDLLKTIEDQFDVFLTVDQKLQYQQKLTASKIAIIPSNRYDDIKPLIPSYISDLKKIKPGEFVSISR